MPNKIITMSLFDRVDYIQQTLNMLGKCNGIEDYHIIMSIDESNNTKQVVKLAEDFIACDKTILVHKKLGCGENIQYVLSKGFDKCDYVIHIEDDILFAYDTLKYFEWAKQFVKNNEIFTVCAFTNKRCSINVNDYPLIRYNQWFTPWGWATWKSRWIEMDKMWISNWDVNLNEKVRKDRFQLLPVCSRSQHIGEEGTHVHSHNYLKHKTNYWMDDIKYNGLYILK